MARQRGAVGTGVLLGLLVLAQAGRADEAAALGAGLLDWRPGESLQLVGPAALNLLAPLVTGNFDPVRFRTMPVRLRLFCLMRLRVREQREGVAEDLARLGPAARPALPALRIAAHDGDPHVRRAAVEALKKVERKESRP